MKKPYLIPSKRIEAAQDSSKHETTEEKKENDENVFLKKVEKSDWEGNGV